jgi:hypothetical protein
MTTQEFEENMLLLIRQIEILTYELHMKAKLSPLKDISLPRNIECVCEVTLNCMNYTTIDRFNSSMSFDNSDIKKIAVSLVSSFFSDYFQSLSLKVNKK